jgi:hypothetical protein
MRASCCSRCCQHPPPPPVPRYAVHGLPRASKEEAAQQSRVWECGKGIREDTKEGEEKVTRRSPDMRLSLSPPIDAMRASYCSVTARTRASLRVLGAHGGGTRLVHAGPDVSYTALPHPLRPLPFQSHVLAQVTQRWTRNEGLSATRPRGGHVHGARGLGPPPFVCRGRWPRLPYLFTHNMRHTILGIQTHYPLACP